MDLSTLATPMFSNENPNDDFVFSILIDIFEFVYNDICTLLFDKSQ